MRVRVCVGVSGVCTKVSKSKPKGAGKVGRLCARVAACILLHPVSLSCGRLRVVTQLCMQQLEFCCRCFCFLFVLVVIVIILLAAKQTANNTSWLWLWHNTINLGNSVGPICVCVCPTFRHYPGRTLKAALCMFISCDWHFNHAHSLCV